VLKKMGVQVRASKSAIAYNSGSTTQIPAGLVISVGNSRVTRQIGFGNQKVIYEKDKRNAA
jgi:transposase